MTYDRIAVVYDFLAKLVFGKSIRQSQVPFFTDIYENSTILIVGGGSGWILNHLPSSSKVSYIEPSKKMTKLARRVRPQLNVEFVTRNLEDVEIVKEFDIVITNFFLDLYSAEEMEPIVQKIGKHLRPGGKWLATDFQNLGIWRHRYMLTIMYYFFRLTTGLKTKKLPDWQNVLTRGGMETIRRREFANHFIVSVELGKA